MNVAKVYQNRADTLVSKMTQLFLTQNGVSSVTSSQWAFDVLPVSEHMRHKEVKETPQLHQIVLQWSTSQQKSTLGIEAN